MGDVRFERPISRVRDARDPAAVIHALADEEVIAALAAASRDREPYLANVLATEALNRVRRQRVAFANLGEGVFVVDEEAMIVDANPAAERALGWSRTEIVGQDAHDLLCPAEEPAEDCMVLRVLRTGKMERADHARLRARSGSLADVAMTVSPSLRLDIPEEDATGEDVAGAVVVFRDISPLRQEAERLRARHERHEERTRALLALGTRLGQLAGQDFETALRDACDVCARTLKVARVGIWLFDEDDVMLRCVALHDEAAGEPPGAVVDLQASPKYLAALTTHQSVAVHDVMTDDRTSELADFVVPRKITSLLDAPVRVEGKLRGVVCHEHVGPRRRWTKGEEHFSSSVAALVALALESHERLKAEEAARRVVEEMRALADAADGAGIGFLTYQGDRCVFASTAAARILGVSVEMARAASWESFLDPRDLARVRNWGMRPPMSFEIPIRRPDGTRARLEVGLATVGSGADGSTVVVLRDASASAALDARYRLVAEETNDVISVHDLEGRYLFVSPSVRQLMGYSPSDLLGVLGYELIHPDDVDILRQEHASALAQPGTGRRATVRARHKDGSWVWVELTGRVAVDPGGEAPGQIVIVTRDASARVAAEAALARRIEDLASMNQELEAFSASVSHDLRSPLRAIDALSEALLEDEGDRLSQEGQATLRHLRKESTRLRRLVDDLLQLSRVGYAQIEREDVDVTALAREILDDLKAGEPSREVVAVVEEGMRVRADRDLTRVILANLLSNAWKFTRPRHPAHIEVGRGTMPAGPPGVTAVYVRDDGVGFDPARAARMFQPFQRLHAATEFEGTGVGLATVRRIVARHEGHVWAEGAPGRGATFWFSLEPPGDAGEA